MVRAVAEAGRDDIALYTGNDDNIIPDLVTPYRFDTTERRFVGGLVGRGDDRYARGGDRAGA